MAGDKMGLMQSVRKLIGTAEATDKNVTGVERRRYRRIQEVKLTILIGDLRFKTRDWSLGGFRIFAPELVFRSNDLISGFIHGPGLFDRGSFEGFVAWVSETGEMGVRFAEVSRDSFLAMSAAQR